MEIHRGDTRTVHPGCPTWGCCGSIPGSDPGVTQRQAVLGVWPGDAPRVPWVHTRSAPGVTHGQCPGGWTQGALGLPWGHLEGQPRRQSSGDTRTFCPKVLTQGHYGGSPGGNPGQLVGDTRTVHPGSLSWWSPGGTVGVTRQWPRGNSKVWPGGAPKWNRTAIVGRRGSHRDCSFVAFFLWY